MKLLKGAETNMMAGFLSYIFISDIRIADNLDVDDFIETYSSTAAFPVCINFRVVWYSP